MLGTLLGAGILSGLGVAAGFALFIVPGFYLAAIWAVIAPVIVIERRGLFDAFGPSPAAPAEPGSVPQQPGDGLG